MFLSRNERPFSVKPQGQAWGKAGVGGNVPSCSNSDGKGATEGAPGTGPSESFRTAAVEGAGAEPQVSTMGM